MLGQVVHDEVDELDLAKPEAAGSSPVDPANPSSLRSLLLPGSTSSGVERLVFRSPFLARIPTAQWHVNRSRFVAQRTCP